MRHQKFYFNPKTLQYEKYKPTFLKQVLNFFGIGLLSLLVGAGITAIFLNYFETPQETALKEEVNEYQEKFNDLQSRINQISNTVEDLEERDSRIYRSLFEAEPIPSGVREGGFGGVERYSHLEDFDNSEILIDATRNIDQLENQLQVLSNSFEEVKDLALKKEEKLSSIPAIQPVDNDGLSRIASGFGRRVHPIYGTVQHHDGLDFAASRGTAVYATGDGKVVKTEKSQRGYGNKVLIDHGFGYETLYAHLYEIEVQRGEKVQRGELIGKVGSTGMSSAPHLHYEVHKEGQPIDPINYFHNDIEPDDLETIIKFANQANQSMD